MPKYQVTEFKKMPAPNNSNEANWFSYIISNNINHISGYRQGSQHEVKQYLNETILRLNKKYKIPTYRYHHTVNKAYETNTAY